MAPNILTATSLDDRMPADWLAFTNRIDAGLDRNGKSGNPGEQIPGTDFGSEYAGKKTLDLFWRRLQKPAVEMWGERVGRRLPGRAAGVPPVPQAPDRPLDAGEFWDSPTSSPR